MRFHLRLGLLNYPRNIGQVCAAKKKEKPISEALELKVELQTLCSALTIWPSTFDEQALW